MKNATRVILLTTLFNFSSLASAPATDAQAGKALPATHRNSKRSRYRTAAGGVPVEGTDLDLCFGRG